MGVLTSTCGTRGRQKQVVLDVGKIRIATSECALEAPQRSAISHSGEDFIRELELHMTVRHVRATRVAQIASTDATNVDWRNSGLTSLTVELRF